MTRPKTSFDTIHLTRDCDCADVWAAKHEFRLRQRRMHNARIGLNGVIRETTDALNKFNAAFRAALTGDPDLA